MKGTAVDSADVEAESDDRDGVSDEGAVVDDIQETLGIGLFMYLNCHASLLGALDELRETVLRAGNKLLSPVGALRPIKPS